MLTRNGLAKVRGVSLVAGRKSMVGKISGRGRFWARSERV